MPKKANPYLPVDRARDKQHGTDIRQRESTEEFAQAQADLARKQREEQVQNAVHAKETEDLEEGEA